MTASTPEGTKVPSFHAAALLTKISTGPKTASTWSNSQGNGLWISKVSFPHAADCPPLRRIASSTSSVVLPRWTW